MKKGNFITHETIIEELKEAIANIEDVKSFSMIEGKKSPISKNVPSYYTINIITKDNIKYETEVSTDSLQIGAYEKDLSTCIKFITDYIQNRLKIKRKTLKKEREINKALEQYYK